MKFYKVGEKVAIRQAFGEALTELAKYDKKIVALTADLSSSLSLDNFAAAFPKRFFNVGVAEQNMIGVAAGLSLSGLVPFAGTFGCFLGRTLDHVRQSIAHNKLNVKIVGSHSGISNAEDGVSAHAVEDLAFFRAIFGLEIVMPADANQTLKAVAAVAKSEKATYLRLYREPLPVFTTEQDAFVLGKAEVLRKGKDVTLVACGPQVFFSLEVAEAVKKEKNLEVEVINCHTLAPLDSKTILESAKKTGRVITVEDHNIIGGLGSAVAEVLAENQPTKLSRVGLRAYAESGSYAAVTKKAGIDKDAIKKAVLSD